MYSHQHKRCRYIIFSGIIVFLLTLGMQRLSQANQIMSSIPHGIHLTYNATSQEFAQPPEWIAIMISSAQGAGDPSVVKQFVDNAKKRAVNGPVKTDTVEYWGTMQRLMYAEKKRNACVVYDGEKYALGAALDIVPDFLRQPGGPRSALNIFENKDSIAGDIPYLGIYQPEMELFDKQMTLSETKSLSTGEERIYQIPSSADQSFALRYDKYSHLTALTVYANYKNSIVREKYQFSDYAMLDGIAYPRTVIQTKMNWCIDKNKKTINFPNIKVVYRVTNATAKPIPNSFFALSTARPGIQVEDTRFKIPGSSQYKDMIIYTYSNSALSIDEASKKAHRILMNGEEMSKYKQQRTVAMIKYGCMLVILLVFGRSVLMFLRNKEQPQG